MSTRQSLREKLIEYAALMQSSTAQITELKSENQGLRAKLDEIRAIRRRDPDPDSLQLDAIDKVLDR